MNQHHHYNFFHPKLYKQVGIFLASSIFSIGVYKIVGTMPKTNVFSTDESRDELIRYRQQSILPGENSLMEVLNYAPVVYDKVPKFDKRDEVNENPFYNYQKH